MAATAKSSAPTSARTRQSGKERTRSDNRRVLLLDTAAELFAGQGFHGTSMRDIAGRVGMLPGSVYYHFASKDQLLAAVYEEGVARIDARVKGASAAQSAPWARLEAACTAHLEMILERSAYAQVLIRVLPSDIPDASDALSGMRNGYEAIFRDLIDALNITQSPNAPSTRHLRLMILGAMNWSPVWFHDGPDTPADIAHGFLAPLRALYQTQPTDKQE